MLRIAAPTSSALHTFVIKKSQIAESLSAKLRVVATPDCSRPIGLLLASFS